MTTVDRSGRDRCRQCRNFQNVWHLDRSKTAATCAMCMEATRRRSWSLAARTASVPTLGSTWSRQSTTGWCTSDAATTIRTELLRRSSRWERKVVAGSLALPMNQRMICPNHHAHCSSSSPWTLSRKILVTHQSGSTLHSIILKLLVLPFTVN